MKKESQEQSITLSANTLFHFTTRESLIGILINYFHPKYSLEDFSALENRRNLAIPMVCFCDILLSQIHLHFDNYAPYGIGMKKKWGTDRGICPVLYYYKGAETAKVMSEAMKKGYEIVSRLSDEEFIIQGGLLDSANILANFTKLYTGKDKNGKKRRLYDEREWRYIPTFGGTTALYIPEKVFKNKDERIIEHEEWLAQNARLEFTPNDINYLIINEESERTQFIGEVKNIKTMYSPEKIEVLISKIISVEQIKEDY